MARPMKLVHEITDPDEIKAFLEYIERPATEKEIEFMKSAREIYKNTKVIDRRKRK